VVPIKFANVLARQSEDVVVFVAVFFEDLDMNLKMWNKEISEYVRLKTE
jgi:hypothetical protein